MPQQSISSPLRLPMLPKMLPACTPAVFPSPMCGEAVAETSLRHSRCSGSGVTYVDSESDSGCTCQRTASSHECSLHPFPSSGNSDASSPPGSVIITVWPSEVDAASYDLCRGALSIPLAHDECRELPLLEGLDLELKTLDNSGSPNHLVVFFGPRTDGAERAAYSSAHKSSEGVDKLEIIKLNANT
ncbi:hypothetical protein WOLCODRAFT_164949 [Wolfiporia cocos MD-104 SS10]|uniref:Uncharacterized protein n=1 Tax=Wolfiporia cocos (strain MD-104) TaxID=742152 RepID=A0A2H3JPQ6_WOLCO|nr:hypothetical protein WOLCODRAFT_164949 [Wolfiporia cocos MD-104 SS10]